MMKSQGRKRLCALLAAVLALCLLGACGSEPAVQLLDEPEAQPEYLSFFSSEDISDSNVSKYWIERFTERYNKQVYINFDRAAYYAEEGLSYRELIERRLESSAPDDLYIIAAEDVLAFEKKGYWMDLSGMDFVDNLSEAALYQSSYNGKVFSVPLTFTGFGFAWNLDLLAAHGLRVPENLEEFLRVCETLKAAGVLPYGANRGYALTVPAMCAGLSQLYGEAEQAQRIAALNSGQTPISTYMHEGFAFLALMIERGYLDPAQALDATPKVEDLELFRSGGCAFICAGLGDIYDWPDPGFELELTGLPLLAEGSVAVYGADKRLCVNPNSKHLETALEFIEMVGTPEALAESAALEHAMSSAKGGGSAGLPAGARLAAQLQQPGQIPNQDFALHFNIWESIRDVARALCAGKSVEQACALLDEQQRADLEIFG